MRVLSVFLLLLFAIGLSAAGELRLTCFKSSAANGRGWHLELPQPASADADFSCEAVIEPPKQLKDQGLRAMLRLSADPRDAAAPGTLLAGVEFFKGSSLHARYQALPEEAVFDQWGRYPADAPIRVRIDFNKAAGVVKVSWSAAGQAERSREFPVKETPVNWKWFSLVSWRNSGAENLSDTCTIRDFKVNGQELQADEFRASLETAPADPVGNRPFTAFLDRAVRPALPVPGVPFFNTLDWRNFPCNSFDYAAYQVVPVEGQPFPNALRMTGLKRPIAFHTVQIAGRRNEAPIRKGDLLFMQFSARCLQSADESGDGVVDLLLVADGASWHSLGAVKGSFGREWRTFYGYAVAKQDFDPGKVRVHLFLSHLQQTVELGGVAVLNLGQGVDPDALPRNRLAYDGRPSEEWRKKAAANIDRYRKADLTIEVADAAGKVLPGAGIRLEMTRHAFGFGCYADDAPLLVEGPEGDRFREEFLRYFNMAIVPMFWGPGNAENKRWGWENPASRQRYLATAEWCAKNGLATQAHVLVWPSSMYAPPDVPALKGDPAKLQARILEHIASVIRANGGNIGQYQVLNEPCGTMEFSNVVGPAGVAEWFKSARRLAPGKPLLINDNGILSRFSEKQAQYETLIADLLAAGAPIDAIGFQGHIGSELPGPELLWRVFDRFARFGKPIQITEFTVGLKDEALQGEYTADFLTAAFAHPALSAVTTWGLWAGKHYSETCAYLRRDWSAKPNAEAYRRLVLGEWMTRVKTTSSPDGSCRVRGFLGDYQLEVTANGKTIRREFRLQPGDNRLQVRMD